MLDMENEAQIVALLPYDPQGKLLLAASNGRGFLAEMAELIAETRKGRQVVNLKAGVKLMVIRPVPPSADHVAVVGENRKLVVFPIAELPVMARGQGVQLQRYRDGSLSDATTFRLEEGLSWTMGGDSGRVRTEKDMGLWRVARGAAGRLPPNGFPRSNKFDG
jgi:topoisomerase-4 subunit A